MVLDSHFPKWSEGNFMEHGVALTTRRIKPRERVVRSSTRIILESCTFWRKSHMCTCEMSKNQSNCARFFFLNLCLWRNSMQSNQNLWELMVVLTTRSLPPLLHNRICNVNSVTVTAVWTTFMLNTEICLDTTSISRLPRTMLHTHLYTFSWVFQLRLLWTESRLRVRLQQAPGCNEQMSLHQKTWSQRTLDFFESK